MLTVGQLMALGAIAETAGYPALARRCYELGNALHEDQEDE